MFKFISLPFRIITTLTKISPEQTLAIPLQTLICTISTVQKKRQRGVGAGLHCTAPRLHLHMQLSFFGNAPPLLTATVVVPCPPLLPGSSSSDKKVKATDICPTRGSFSMSSVSLDTVIVKSQLSSFR